MGEDNRELQGAFEKIKSYLATNKMFVPNPERLKETNKAISIAKELFADKSYRISVESDALQTGAIVLSVDGYDVTMRKGTETEMFSSLIALADNFEIYSTGIDTVRFAAMFQSVYSVTIVPKGK